MSAVSAPGGGGHVGILLRDGDALYFVPAEVARKLAPMPAVTRVPGAPAELLGIAQVDGAILPIVSIGKSTPRALVVCSHAGEDVGLAGVEIVGLGVNDPGNARSIDLSAIHARLQAGPWAGRWRG